MDASTQADLAIGKAKGKGAELAPGTIKTKPLRDGLSELLHLRAAKDDAAEAFGDAVKAIAKQTGLYPSTIKNLVKAKHTDGMEKMSREVEQLAMVFDEFAKQPDTAH